MMNMSRRHCPTGTVLCLLATVGLPAAAGAAAAIQPALPSDTVYGLKLVDWEEAYFQWAVSIPTSVIPTDPSGLNGAIGQRAPVWFIPGAFTGKDTADIAVPEGMGILLSARSRVYKGQPGAQTEDQLAIGPTMYVDEVTTLEVTLDGVPVSNPKQYRVRTPVFTITIPPDNVFGDDQISTVEDERKAAVADGYWFLFPPLPLGHHVLTKHLAGTNDDGTTFDNRWTFNLNIEEANVPSQ
jgi:hypothetical protein